MTWALIAGFGALGAVLRYLAERLHARIHAARAAHEAGPPIPWGVFGVNVAGSFLLGWVSASVLILGGPWVAGLGVGLAGSLTTFSTFSTDLVLLARRTWLRFAGYALLSVGAGLAAAAAGWLVGS